MDGLELASKVSTSSIYEVGNPDAKYKVALMDFGVKQNIIRCLVERDCYVKVYPQNTKLEEIKAFNPNGIMLSNGPGDPAVMHNEIQNVKEMTESGIPIFGICLGHQILALGQGLKTEKMHNGHRGINHPIMNLITGKSEITSQNHGFVVTKDSIADHSNITMTHVHLNDETVAGIKFNDRKIFSVQYHPEASAGPHDSRYLFDQFIDNMNS